MKYLAICAIIAIAGCSEPPAETSLPETELQKVRSVLQSYVDGWKAMDSAAVLGLFTEDAVISPSGLHPKDGKQALRDFWFPDDGSRTEIQSYDIEVLDSGGSGNFAYSYERGELSFTYVRGETQMTRTSRAYSTTLYRRVADGSWKIFRRMWSDIRIE